jgi:hypothetical protein
MKKKFNKNLNLHTKYTPLPHFKSVTSVIPGQKLMPKFDFGVLAALSPSFSLPPRSPPDLLYDVLTTTSAKNDSWLEILIRNIPYRILNKVVAAAAGARN